MKILIIGRSEVLYETCLNLRENNHEICGIITAKEAPEYTRTSLDFELLAKNWAIPFLHTADINSQSSLDFIKMLGKIDIGISFNCVNVIGKAVINRTSLGILNAHAGDLPRYRGNACQAWAIVNGEKHTALCVHKMIPDELDSGDIITRAKLNITLKTSIGEAHQWMTDTVPELFLTALVKLAKNKNYVLKKQSKSPRGILRCYPRKPEDGRIDWSKSNVEILRLINASSEPYSGAFACYKNKPIIIWRAELVSDKERFCAVPGQICAINKTDGSVIVVTGSTKLKIYEVSYDEARTKPALIIKSLRDRLTSMSG